MKFAASIFAVLAMLIHSLSGVEVRPCDTCHTDGHSAFCHEVDHHDDGHTHCSAGPCSTSEQHPQFDHEPHCDCVCHTSEVSQQPVLLADDSSSLPKFGDCSDTYEPLTKPEFEPQVSAPSLRAPPDRAIRFQSARRIWWAVFQL